jgi:hypothetical protein
MTNAGRRPILNLSGPKLRAALAQVIAAAEPVGGVERFAGAVRLRAEVIRDRVGDGRHLSHAGLDEIVVLMPTARRRLAATIETLGWPEVQSAIVRLLLGAIEPGTADARMARFEADLRVAATAAASDSAPQQRTSERYLRDFAAELLHACYPEHYPLMTRWVWDAGANTGVLREIWHDTSSGTDDVDHVLIDVPDTHEAFLVLREELSQFLSQNGIFRDMLWYVDLLQAHIYAIYISAQGSVYLKADFAAEGDPLEHTRRILGMDRIGGRTARKAVNTRTLADETLAGPLMREGGRS